MKKDQLQEDRIYGCHKKEQPTRRTDERSKLGRQNLWLSAKGKAHENKGRNMNCKKA